MKLHKVGNTTVGNILGFKKKKIPKSSYIYIAPSLS